mmetsp:Transcript_68515/g.161054  ORF Transcript_68515/g.161054 Transcript_68515/m.161054 type:complete len:272 (-) Transcript_68515:327-1142(-)
MHGGHGDHKRKQVVDDRVQKLVHHGTPRHVCHRLEFVIDEELRGHHDETKGIDAAYGSTYDPTVPALMLQVEHREEGVAEDDGKHHPTQVANGEIVVCLGLVGRIALLVVEHRVRYAMPATEVDVTRFVHLPDLDHETDAGADEDHPGGFSIEEVEENDTLTHNVEEDGADGQPLHALDFAPEGDVVLEREHVEHTMQDGHHKRHTQQNRVPLEQDLLELVFAVALHRSHLLVHAEGLVHRHKELPPHGAEWGESEGERELGDCLVDHGGS